mgnify:CR=1 FL=1
MFLVPIRNGVERAIRVEFVILVLGPDDLVAVHAAAVRFRSGGELGVIVLENVFPRFADLPLALGLLAGSGQIPDGSFVDTAFVGELGLDGNLQPVRGVLSMAEGCKRAGLAALGNEFGFTDNNHHLLQLAMSNFDVKKNCFLRKDLPGPVD